MGQPRTTGTRPVPTNPLETAPLRKDGVVSRPDPEKALRQAREALSQWIDDRYKHVDRTKYGSMDEMPPDRPGYVHPTYDGSMEQYAELKANLAIAKRDAEATP